MKSHQICIFAAIDYVMKGFLNKHGDLDYLLDKYLLNGELRKNY